MAVFMLTSWLGLLREGKKRLFGSSLMQSEYFLHSSLSECLDNWSLPQVLLI